MSEGETQGEGAARRIKRPRGGGGQGERVTRGRESKGGMGEVDQGAGRGGAGQGQGLDKCNDINDVKTGALYAHQYRTRPPKRLGVNPLSLTYTAQPTRAHTITVTPPLIGRTPTQPPLAHPYAQAHPF